MRTIDGQDISSEVETIPIPKIVRRISELNFSCPTPLNTRLATKRCKNVLIIVTGGTIAMKRDSKTGSLIPANGFIKQEIKKTPSLHDQEYFEKYATMCNLDKTEQEDTFVLPRYTKTENRVVYTVLEYKNLLDSCNIHIENYCLIAKTVYDAYEKYDGFVIVHGTDTMAYTASYLSFMFENLGKTVILTGSQIPLCASRSDGVDNLQGSILIAGNYVIPEVTLFFHHKLFRGNRVIKVDSSNFDAYHSANVDPLMTLGVHIKTNWDIVWRSRTPEKFRVFYELNPNIGLLRLFPGITVETVRAFTSPPIQGIALQSYGAGNGPSNRPDILQILKNASERGVLIINCTQCQKGGVSVAYETGKALYDAGAVPGYDITPEAALAKLSYITGKQGLTNSEKRQFLLSNMRGELSKQDDVQVKSNNKFIMAVADAMKLSSKSEIDTLKLALFPALLCAAAKQDDLDALETLLSQGADVSLQDYDGRSALHISVSEGNISTVNFLLHQGASVYVQDRFGNTPLIDAIYFKRHECIKVLRKAGAHLTISENVAGNALCNLAFQRDLDGLKAWHEAGAKLTETDYENRSALHIAVMTENVLLVKYLLPFYETIDIVDSTFKTPIDIALNNGNEEILNLLKTIESK